MSVPTLSLNANRELLTVLWRYEPLQIFPCIKGIHKKWASINSISVVKFVCEEFRLSLVEERLSSQAVYFCFQSICSSKFIVNFVYEIWLRVFQLVLFESTYRFTPNCIYVYVMEFKYSNV